MASVYFVNFVRYASSRALVKIIVFDFFYSLRISNFVFYRCRYAKGNLCNSGGLIANNSRP